MNMNEKQKAVFWGVTRILVRMFNRTFDPMVWYDEREIAFDFEGKDANVIYRTAEHLNDISSMQKSNIKFSVMAEDCGGAIPRWLVARW